MVSPGVSSLIIDPLVLISINVGILGIAIGIAAGALFYFRAKKEKKPTYALRSYNVIKDLESKIKSIRVLYLEKPIKTLTTTKLLFLNEGRDTIRREDIASKDPLMIRVLEPFEILNSRIEKEVNPANAFSLKDNDVRSKNIDFEFCNTGEGVVIQILHTGESGNDISFSGTIKGARKLIRKNPGKPFDPLKIPWLNRELSRKNTRYATALFLGGLPTVLLISLVIASLFRLDPPIPLVVVLLGLIAPIPYVLLGMSIFKKGPPRGLEIFEEDL